MPGHRARGHWEREKPRIPELTAAWAGKNCPQAPARRQRFRLRRENDTRRRWDLSRHIRTPQRPTLPGPGRTRFFPIDPGSWSWRIIRLRPDSILGFDFHLGLRLRRFFFALFVVTFRLLVLRVIVVVVAAVVVVV